MQGSLQPGPKGWKAPSGTPCLQSYIIGTYGNVDAMLEVSWNSKMERRQR